MGQPATETGLFVVQIWKTETGPIKTGPSRSYHHIPTGLNRSHERPVLTGWATGLNRF
jgi:hypothetical protein